MAVDGDSAGRKLEQPTTDEEPGQAAEPDGPEQQDNGVAVDGVGARPPTSRAMTALLAIVVALAALVGWLGYRTHETRQDQLQRNLFVQIARQGALNLTTIDCTEVDADVQRILDSATGTFRDDFEKRSQPFIDIVKHAQSKSTGSITEAALESEQADSAQVLVAVTVNTSISGVAEPQPRAWRMRIAVQKVRDGAKVSTVEFVP